MTNDKDVVAAETDSFPTAAATTMVPVAEAESNPDPPLMMVDRQFLNRMQNEHSNQSRGNNNNNHNIRAGPPSVAATELASAVGSVVGAPRDAFLKSITFLKDQELPETMNTSMGRSWGIKFANANDPITGTLARSNKRQQKLYVDSVEGLFTLSQIQEGDYIKSINHKRCGPSLNAERALERMNQCLEQEGFLSVAVENKELGDDILVQATIIKPKPNMTYEDLGMVVWLWGFLCIKSIGKDSIFKHSVLKSTDHIISINDIVCEGLTPEQFADIIQALPLDVTITVLRRKQRLSGMFG
jgi:hypothetical protein